MNNRIELIFPLVLIIVYVALLIFLRGSVPTPEELVAHFAALYERFGYEIIFLGASLEALVVVNFFIPGVTALALGAVFARSGQLDLTLVIIVAVLGVLTGYIADFILGSFGFGKIISKLGYGKLLVKARGNFNKFTLTTILFGFVHPNVGSFMALAAGTLRMEFGRFFGLAILMSAFWMSVWGLALFMIGDVVLTVLTRHFFIILILFGSLIGISTIYSNRKA